MSSCAVSKYGGAPLVFRVLVPASALVADEDSRRETWFESLAWESCCASKNPVPPDGILGYSMKRYRRVRPDTDSTLVLDVSYQVFRPVPSSGTSPAS